jgi:hypothetical protein
MRSTLVRYKRNHKDLKTELDIGGFDAAQRSLLISFEAGVALVGEPSLYIVLNSGQVCDAGGVHCVNVAGDAQLQWNLQAQTAKYKSDLDPLKTHPIVSGGVAYSFWIRSRQKKGRLFLPRSRRSLQPSRSETTRVAELRAASICD